MNETATADAGRGQEVTAQAPALPPGTYRVPGGRGRALLRRAGAVFGYPLRRPRRCLAIGALLALTGLGAGSVGLFLWADHHLRAAESAAGRYHNGAARDHLRACLWVWRRNPEALLLAARTARRVGALGEAEQFLDEYEGLRGTGDDGLVLERLLLRAERGDVDGVSTFCYARVREGHPDAPLILEALTRNFIRTYRLQDAEASLRWWLDRQPDNTQALLFEGQVREMQERVADALADYRRVVQLDPEHDEARLRLTGVLMQVSQGEEALPHLEYLGRRQPDNVAVQVALARCQALLGRPHDAEVILDGVLARQPHSPAALAERGKLAREAGRTAQAEAWLREAVALDPAEYGARYQLYLCLERGGQEAEARAEKGRLKRVEADLERIQEIVTVKMQRAPHDPALHCEAGLIALRAGSVGEGLRWLRSAIKEDPRYAPAHRALADYYRRVGNATLAARHRELAGEAPAGPLESPGR